MIRSATALLALLGGCGKDDETTPTDTEPTDGTTPTGDTGGTTEPTHTGGTTNPTDGTTTTPDPCDTPLGVEPLVPGVLPLHGTRFVATGGSGEVRFELATDASGALLDEVGGAYVAGPIGNVRDEVRAVDDTCGLDATAAIDVLGGLVVHPSTAVVPPGTSFLLEAEGGSGSITCAPRTMFSGSLSGCTWTAGTAAGTDTILVTDDGTGEEVTVAYTVDPAATAMTLWGTRLYLPAGQPFRPTFLAGTQEVDLTPDRAGLTITDGVISGSTAGTWTVTAEDRYASMTSTFEVDIVPFRTFDAERDGGRYFWGGVASGDVDGDGDDELVVGSPEVSLDAHQSGVVHVWEGTPTGTASSPTFSWSAPQELANSGRAVAMGDTNGDGRPDLAVGSPSWDEAGVGDYGRVDVFEGGVPGLFPDEPDWTVRGESGGDNFGFALAMCDVDGDGYDDLAAAGWADEATGSGVSTQGAVTLWMGSPFGLDLVSSAKVHGMFPVAGVYAPGSNARMGRRLAAGDRDGDGRCDLLATAHDTNLDGLGNDGIAWWYSADDLLGSGEPSRLWTSDAVDDNVQVGRVAAMADVDGDGRDDVLLGGFAADMTGNTRGGVWVFLTADDDRRAAQTPVYLREASVVLQGDDDYDSFGLGLTGGDLDGDGKAEVVVGSQYDELDGSGTYSQGAVRVFPGLLLASAAPGTTYTSDDAVISAFGADPNDAFGNEIGVYDAEGDGVPDLGVYASRDDAEGLEVGAVWEMDVDGATTRLAFPGEASGAHLGDEGSVGWVDLDGDGDPDPVAGAWGQPFGVDGVDAGVAFGFAGGAASTVAFSGLPNHNGSDRLGQAVGSAGDVDGDGREDLALVSWQDSKPASFGVGFANPNECPGSVGGTGVLWILPGSPTGIQTSPIFALYGFTANDHLELVDGGFDADGDGYDDVVVASTGDGVEGGLTLMRGRPRDPLGTTVVCTSTHWLGVSSGARLGSAVSKAGDLDGDGCDELAVGADADDLGFSNQGSVRILWGYGPGCDRGSAEVTTLAPLVANTRVGNTVDGGQDVDGDGVPDVVVGGYDWEENTGVDVGAVWLLSGSWLRTLAKQPATTLPSDTGTTVHALPASAKWAGDQRDAEFGSDVALVRHPTQPSRAWVAAGWRLGTLGGVERSGGALLLAWSGGAWAPNPVGLIGGESWSEAGKAMRGDRRAPVLLVGAPLSDASALDAGAVLPVVVSP